MFKNTFVFNHSKCTKINVLVGFILLTISCLCDAGTENLINEQHGSLANNPATAQSTITSSTEKQNNPPAATFQSAGARTMLRIYDECSRLEGGFVPCLKKKAISFLERITYIDAITIADGIRLVRLPGVYAPKTTDNELHMKMGRSATELDTKLTNVLTERLSQFLSGHSLQIYFPKLTSEEIGRGLEEGRGKMKKMMGMMVMGMAMKMMGMIPVAMGMLYMMAGKALIVSKIALLLAGIMGIKKMMSGRGGGGGGSSGGYSAGGGGGGWSSGGGGGGGGWDRRSLSEAQEMAYRNYRHLNAQRKEKQQNISLPLQAHQQQQNITVEKS